jgi:MFS family permease
MSSSKSPRGLFACFNARLIYSCGLIALSQLNFGMDQSAFSNTQAMPAFQRTFGQYNAVTKKYTLETMFLSLLNSVIFIGFVFGLVTGNLLSRRFGRRIAMFVMCFWALLSAVILILSKTPTQAITGRTIAYVYIGMELALVPVLQSELVPAEARGFVVGTYQSGLMVGLCQVTCVCFCGVLMLILSSSAPSSCPSSAVPRARSPATLPGGSLTASSSSSPRFSPLESGGFQRYVTVRSL